MANALAARLAEQRNRIYKEITDITELAAKEERDLTADEAARFDKGSTDMDEARSRIDQIVAVEKMNTEAEENLRNLLGSDHEQRELDARGATDFESEVRSVLRGDKRGIDLAAPQHGWDHASLRVAPVPLNTTTSGAASELIGRDMASTIRFHMVQTSGVLQAGPTVITTTGGNPLDIPTSTSYGTSALIAEGATFQPSSGTANPTVTKRTLGGYKYGQITQVDKELIDDSAFDIVGFVAKASGIASGLALGANLVTGTGGSQPSGVVTGATSGVTGATTTAGAFSVDNLIDLFFSVTSPYRNSPSCAWLVKDATLAAIRKLKDGSGAYLFSPAPTVGAPDTLYGKPIYSDPNVAAVALSAKSVLFGDFSSYYVRYAGPFRFERSDEFGFGTDVISFRVALRADGILVDQTGAIKYFIGNAA